MCRRVLLPPSLSPPKKKNIIMNYNFLHKFHLRHLRLTQYKLYLRILLVLLCVCAKNTKRNKKELNWRKKNSWKKIVDYYYNRKKKKSVIVQHFVHHTVRKWNILFCLQVHKFTKILRKHHVNAGWFILAS